MIQCRLQVTCRITRRVLARQHDPQQYHHHLIQRPLLLLSPPNDRQKTAAVHVLANGRSAVLLRDDDANKRRRRHGDYYSRFLQVQQKRSIETSVSPYGYVEDELVNVHLHNKQRARVLLEESLHPLGSFTKPVFEEAKRIFEAFKERASEDPDTETVNLSIDLLERIVPEIFRVVKNADSDTRYMLQPRFFNEAVLKMWKLAAKRSQEVLSPEQLLLKLQKLSHTYHPHFQYDLATVGIIMDVAIKQTIPSRAPFVAEALLQNTKQEAAKTGNKNLFPSVFVYNQVLQAWVKSGQPEAVQRIQALLDEMRATEGTEAKPNVVSYNILLRYSAGKGDITRIDQVMAIMDKENIDPDIVSLSQVLHGNAKVGKTQEAETVLLRMLDLTKCENFRHSKLLSEAVQDLLFAYRKIVDSELSTQEEKDQAVQRTRELSKRYTDPEILQYKFSSKLQATVMDVYARAGKCDKAEAILDELQHIPTSYSILFTAYANCDLADRADTVLKRMLQSQKAKPNVFAFNALINSYSLSSSPHALEKAFAALRLMEEDSKCKELGIRPDKITFGALLKCVLLKAQGDDAGMMAETVLDEMERLYLAGNEAAQPDSIAHTLVIKACIQARDTERAAIVMDRMERSDATPNLRTYHEILRCWSLIKTTAAAEQAERFLAKMKLFSITRGSTLKPDAFSYNVVFETWQNSGDPNSAERVWALYEQMKSDEVSMDVACYTRLISFFSQSKERENLAKADLLLESMESETDANIWPDYRHYENVIKGWLEIENVERATRVLVRKTEAFVQGKNLKAQSSPELIDMVIKGWINYGDLPRATALAATIQELHDAELLPVGPGVDVYEDLLGAWTDSDHPEKEDNVAKLQDRINTM